MMKRMSILSAVVALFCAVFVSAADFKPLQQGERIAFLGDSITNGGFFLYYLQTMIGHTGAKLYNFGISGDRSDGGLRRIDILLQRGKPDRVAFFMGMNDVGRGTRNIPDNSDKTPDTELPKYLKIYKDSTAECLRRTYKANATAIMITPPAYDEYWPGCRKNALRSNTWGLTEVATMNKEFAREWNAPVIDLHPVITDAHDMTSDMIHPNDQGAAKMAKTIADAIKKD